MGVMAVGYGLGPAFLSERRDQILMISLRDDAFAASALASR